MRFLTLICSSLLHLKDHFVLFKISFPNLHSMFICACDKCMRCARCKETMMSGMSVSEQCSVEMTNVGPWVHIEYWGGGKIWRRTATSEGRSPHKCSGGISWRRRSKIGRERKARQFLLLPDGLNKESKGRGHHDIGLPLSRFQSRELWSESCISYWDNDENEFLCFEKTVLM